MALFSIRSEVDYVGGLSSIASVKGWNGGFIDLDKKYNTSGDKTYVDNADVVSSVIEIVTKVSRMKMDLIIDEKRVQDRVVYLLNEKPNKRESAYNFKFNVLSESIMRGNSYVEIVRGKGRDGKEEIKELRHIENGSVSVFGLYDDSNSEYIRDVEYYVATQKEGKITETTPEDKVERNIKEGLGRIIKNEDMIHLKPFNFGGLIGISILDYLREDIELSNDSRKFLSHFVKSGGSMGGNLHVESGETYVPTKKKLQIRDEFLETNTHYSSVNVTDGMVKYIPKETSDKVVSSLLENKTTASRFAQMFGLPLHKMGISTSNMSLSQLNQDFRNNTLAIYTEMMESEFNDKFYRVKDDYESTLKVDVASLSALDDEVKQRIAELGTKTGALTLNEIRVLLGFDKKDDIELDKHRVSLNYVDVDIVNDYQINNRSVVERSIDGGEIGE